MSEILRVDSLTRTFGDLKAVEDVSFTVDRGALFAFLGPNGAGKSTTIAMLIGLLKPTSGTITYEFTGASGTVVGRDDRTLKRNLGVVFQESLLDPGLTVRTNLRSRAQFYRLGLDGLDTVAEVLRLSELMNRPYGELSGGQRRRVDIARALINSPQILFLDEPTTGLDPQSRRLVWKTLRELQDELDMTIFLTTHYMEEAEDADQLQIIDHGNLVAGGAPGELKAKHSESRLRVKADHDVLELFTRQGIAATHRDDGLVEAAIPDPRVALDFLAEHKAEFTDFEFVHGTMDDVFLSLTGNALRED